MQLGSQHHQRPAKASMGSEPPRTPGGRGGVGGWGVMFGSPLPQHGSNQTLKFQGLRPSSPPPRTLSSPLPLKNPSPPPGRHGTRGPKTRAVGPVSPVATPPRAQAEPVP